MEALEASIATTFGLSEDGRIAFENEPGRPAGPRLFLAGCREGVRVVLRHDVDAEAARAIAALAARAAPWVDPSADPDGLEDMLALLEREAPVEGVSRSLIYRLPHALPVAPGVRIIRSDTGEGLRWLAQLAETGMPPHLLEAGFLGVSDFWEPWVVALEGDTIAAMAFAARIGPRAAETGVYTFPGFRGRGLAAAVLL
ncbi:MAG: GNAT family N-acetyltransferase, partial [Pseudomonadota bacterium]